MTALTELQHVVNRHKPDGEYQSRLYDVRYEAKEDGSIVGYAAVHNRYSQDLGGFIEIIEPGAFEGREKDDVRALFNHDSNIVLGRTTSGTLKLRVDSEGLAYEITPPETTWGRDVAAMIKRGDVTQSSFGFTIPKGGSEFEQRSDGVIVHRIKKVARLYDVSPVTFPAYQDTEVSVRSLRSFIETQPEDWKVQHELRSKRLELLSKHI